MRIVFFILFIFISHNLFSQANDLNSYYTSLVNLHQFNGNILTSNNNSIIYKKTYNISNIQDSFKVQENSKFIIASVSKVFIKVAILKLTEQQKLNLQDTIGKFIPNFPNGNKITIEQLLFHKSGLPREISNYENYENLTLNQTIELAKKEKLLFEPNTEIAYSNVGYFILHKIIDNISTDGYFNYMQKKIFNKLKLKNTFEYNYSKNRNHFVYGFTNEDGYVEQSETKTINQFETGNILTTINDLFLFSKKIWSSNLLSEKSKAILFSNDGSITQAGGRPGYRAYFYCSVKTKITFILLSNQSNIPFEDIVKQTTNILSSKPFILPIKTERKDAKLPINTLLRYEGTFVSKEHNLNFTTQVKNNYLVIKEPNGRETTLFAETNNTFFDNPKSKDTYTFICNEKAEIIALHIVTSGMKVVLSKK